MADNSKIPKADDPLNADVQEALLAAFGDDAMDWLDEDEGLQLLEGTEGEASNPLASETGLDDLLEQLSSAIDGNTLDDFGFETEIADEPDLKTRLDVGPRYVVFEVGDQHYGVPLDGVLEIDRCGKVTALPRTPNWLRGVTNLRGQILSVTDFRKLLRLTDQRRTVGEKIIVVRSERHDASTALVVDRVLGIRNLSSKQGPVEGLSESLAIFANSLAVMDQTTTVLIDPDRLIGSNELAKFSSE